MSGPPIDPPESQRLDKWLWCARFFKSRSLANALLGAGRLRLSGKTVSKAHQRVRPGDVLTFPQGARIRVVRVLALAARRGPAAEAGTLYEDLAPADPAPADPAPAEPISPPAAARAGRRERGEGRPTKRDRRAIDRLRPPE